MEPPEETLKFNRVYLDDMLTLKRTNWPSQSCECKVVQVYLDDEPYLRFQEEERFHSGILTRFVADAGLSYATAEGHNGTDAPALSGNGYRVVGMGWALIDVDKKTVFLSGKSKGYRIGIDSAHAKKIAACEKGWVFG